MFYLELRKRLFLWLVLPVLLAAGFFYVSRPARGEESSGPRFFYSCTASGSESGMVNYGIEEAQVRQAIAEQIQKSGGILVKSLGDADYEAAFKYEAEFGLVRCQAKIKDLKNGTILTDSEDQKEVSGMTTDAVQVMTNLSINFAREIIAGFFEKNKAVASKKTLFAAAQTPPKPAPAPVVSTPKPPPIPEKTITRYEPAPAVAVIAPKPAPAPVKTVSTPPPPIIVATPKPTPPPVIATPKPTFVPVPTPRVTPKPLPTPKIVLPVPATPAPPPPSSESEGEPPEITMTYPEEPESHTTEKTITLAGVIRDPEGIENYTISANGVQIFPPKNSRNVVLKAKGIPISTQVDLKVGENVIIISATDKRGNPAQNFIKVHREASIAGGAGSSHSQVASKPVAPSKVSLWAVVVGINRYEDSEIQSLKYAVPDAQAFKNFVESQKTSGLYKAVHIKYLVNKDATLRNLKTALGVFLNDARQDDVVYVFIASHGAVDPQGDSYILTCDANFNSLYSTALPMEEFKKLLMDRIFAERTIVIADACHSGGIGNNTRGAREIDMNEFKRFLETSKGRAILTASRAKELSQEDSKLGHGLFTFYLLEGLSGKADANGDNIVTVSELFDYVNEKVVKISRGSQHPELKGNFDNNLPLAIPDK
ncbi:MAG: caspase family protein [bacterium]